MFFFNKPFNKISLGLLLLLMLGLVGLFYSSAVRKGDALKGTDSNVRYPSELKTVSPAAQPVEAPSDILIRKELKNPNLERLPQTADWNALQSRKKEMISGFSSSEWSLEQFEYYIQRVEAGELAATVSMLYVAASCREKKNIPPKENCALIGEWYRNHRLQDSSFNLFDSYEKLALSGDEEARFWYYRVLRFALESGDINVRQYPDAWRQRQQVLRQLMWQQVYAGDMINAHYLLFDLWGGENLPPNYARAAALSRYIYESDPVSYFELEGFEQEFIEMYDVDPQEVESLYQSLFLGKN